MKSSAIKRFIFTLLLCCLGLPSYAELAPFYLDEDLNRTHCELARANNSNYESPHQIKTPYMVVNNNTPSFSKPSSTKSYEKYSKLDSLGRCGTAEAMVGVDLMPKGKREGIEQVKPSGWKTMKYNNIEGKYLYNRCHLIGYQLSGENANKRNLITGTRYLNVTGMLPFENMVADYVKETRNHVLYRVTPCFKGNNLVAHGVQMEAKSIEDNGEGVMFNVYVYNIQPGISIDYASGDSRKSSAKDVALSVAPVKGKLTTPTSLVSDTKKKKSKKKKAQKSAKKSKKYPKLIPVQSKPKQQYNYTKGVTIYILNEKTHKFHRTKCNTAKKLTKTSIASRDDLIKQGYKPCKKCNP